MCHERIMQNSLESPRLWGLHLERKSLPWLILVCCTFAQVGVWVCTWFAYPKIIVRMPWIYQRIMMESTSLKFPMLWNIIGHQIWDTTSLWISRVYTKCDPSLHKLEKQSLHQVYMLQNLWVYTLYIHSLHTVSKHVNQD